MNCLFPLNSLINHVVESWMNEWSENILKWFFTFSKNIFLELESMKENSSKNVVIVGNPRTHRNELVRDFRNYFDPSLVRGFKFLLVPVRDVKWWFWTSETAVNYISWPWWNRFEPNFLSWFGTFIIWMRLVYADLDDWSLSWIVC